MRPTWKRRFASCCAVYRKEARAAASLRSGPINDSEGTLLFLLTDRRQDWIAGNPLYVRLEAGVGGLPANSVVLLDQVRALDVTRMARLLGRLSVTEYAPIQQGLKGLLKL